MWFAVHPKQILIDGKIQSQQHLEVSIFMSDIKDRFKLLVCCHRLPGNLSDAVAGERLGITLETSRGYRFGGEIPFLYQLGMYPIITRASIDFGHGGDPAIAMF